MRADPIAWLLSHIGIARHAQTPPDPADAKSVAEYERRRAALRAATTERHETAP